MKILNIFRKKEKKVKSLVDFYELSVEKIGRDQILKMVERGTSMPVVTL